MPRRFSISSASLAVILAGLVDVGAPAQTPPAPPASAPVGGAVPTLAEERAAFLRQILTDSQTLTDQYERALAKLELELAASADYEEARLVQQRRLELRSLYADDPTMAQSRAVLLAADQARLIGSTEVRSGMLTGWRTAASAAEWTNLRLPPGRYFLELEANMVETPANLGILAPGRSQPQKRAFFEFFEVSLLAGLENRRSFEITTSPDSNSFVPLRIGPLTFSRSPVTLRLAAAAGYPGNVLHLRNLRLISAADAEIPAAPGLPASTTALAEARDKMAAELAAAQRQAIADYKLQLQTLAAAGSESQEEARAEEKRLGKILATTRNDGAALLRQFASRGGVAGFESIEGARFVANAGNSGDHFMIEHEGGQLMVRLMWVQAAPLDPKDPARKAFAKHFGIEEDDTPALARAAQEFTAGYLEGKNLRLLIRPGRDKDGAARALLFLPEIGLYQNVLVDQGLAAVQPPPDSVRVPAMERALLGFLQEREQTARRQHTGAWALSPEERR